MFDRVMISSYILIIIGLVHECYKFGQYSEEVIAAGRSRADSASPCTRGLNSPPHQSLTSHLPIVDVWRPHRRIVEMQLYDNPYFW